MRPRLHRVLAPAILLVVTAAALPPALVVLAVCRRLPGAPQAARSEARVSPLRLTIGPGTRQADLPVLPRAVAAPRGPAS